MDHREDERRKGGLEAQYPGYNILHVIQILLSDVQTLSPFPSS
jgi:hypothetical protein